MRDFDASASAELEVVSPYNGRVHPRYIEQAYKPVEGAGSDEISGIDAVLSRPLKQLFPTQVAAPSDVELCWRMRTAMRRKR